MHPIESRWLANQFEEDMRAPEFRTASQGDQGGHAWHCQNCGVRLGSQVTTDEVCLQCGSQVKWVRV